MRGNVKGTNFLLYILKCHTRTCSLLSRRFGLPMSTLVDEGQFVVLG